MFQCVFPESRYQYHTLFENNSKISVNEIRSCPRFWFGGENWNFDLSRNNSSMSIKVIRWQPLTNILLKSQVTVTDKNCTMAKYVSKQFKSETSANRDISYELAVLNEFSFKETLEINQSFDIKVELVLYEITTDDEETGLLKVEDKVDVQRLLSEDILKMYDNEVYTDVVLNIRGEKIHAHKSILCASSTVLAKLCQKKNAKYGGYVVDIKNFSTATMRKLVDFMYSRVNFNYDIDEAMDLYYAANKYGLLKMKEMCGQIIRHKINEGNADRVLYLADKQKDDNLKKAAMEFIKSNLKSCIKSEWWDEFVTENPELHKELITFCNKR